MTTAIFQAYGKVDICLQVTDQPRILVLLGYWDEQAHAVRLQLHLCKPVGMGFEVCALSADPRDYPL